MVRILPSTTQIIQRVVKPLPLQKIDLRSSICLLTSGMKGSHRSGGIFWGTTPLKLVRRPATTHKAKRNKGYAHHRFVPLVEESSLLTLAPPQYTLLEVGAPQVSLPTRLYYCTPRRRGSSASRVSAHMCS